MYILHCSDGSYYTGSTTDLDLRLEQHMEGKGANHTRKRLPVKLLYFEEYQRIDEAYYREKQVQGWNRKKKEALIDGKPELLPDLAIAYRDRNAPKPQSRPEEAQSRSDEPQSRPEESQSRPDEPQSRPEGLEGQSHADEMSSESATPFGFECLSQRGSLSRRGPLASVSNQPKSRPEVLEGQPHEAQPKKSLQNPNK